MQGYFTLIGLTQKDRIERKHEFHKARLLSIQHFAYQCGTESSDFPAEGGKIAVPNAPARCCKIVLIISDRSGRTYESLRLKLE